MSLAQPPSFQSPVYNPSAAFNPFGPGATLGSDQIQRVSPVPARLDIQAPQGRAPANFATLAPPPPASRPESRPDFARGFGVEIPEEEEPEEEPRVPVEIREESVETEVEDAGNEEEDQDDVSTVAQSRIHSRHVSKLSVALSLCSVGGIIDDGTSSFVEAQRGPIPARSPDGSPVVEDVDEIDQDAVGEWTGSEDLRTGAETSEDEVSVSSVASSVESS